MSKKRKLLIIGAIAAVLVIAIVVIVIVASIPRDKDDNISFFYSNEDNVTYYLYGSRLGDTPIVGTVSATLFTCDGSVALAQASSGELWHISGNIAQSIGMSNGVFAIAPSNGSVYYMGSSTLYRFDAEKQASSIVSNNFSADSLVSSPSGTCVLAEKDGKLKLHDGQFVRNLVGDEMTPLAVSDSGDIAYALSDDGCLYVYKSGEKNRLTSELSDGELIFTIDAQSVIFSSGGRLYASEKGERKRLVAEDVSSSVLLSLARNDAELVRYGRAVYADVNTFVGELLLVDDSIIHISSDFESSVRISDIDIASGIWTDGKTLRYVKNEVLYSTQVKNLTAPEAVVSSVAYFVHSEKNGITYYIDKSGKLRGIKGEKVGEVISDADAVFAKSDGNVLYISDGELYVTSDAKNSVMLSRDVASVSVGVHSAYYLKSSDGKFVLYSVDSGYKFKEIKSNISFAVQK